MSNKLYQKLETVGTVLWLISDFIWMCGYNSLAAILITPVVLLMALACIKFSGSKMSELLSITAGTFWVLMNACWIYSEITEKDMYLLCAKASFFTACIFVYLSFRAAKKENSTTDFTRLKIK